MKQKIKITGANIHDLLYESFLMGLAFDASIMRFRVQREIKDGKQVVILTLEVDEDQINSFKHLLEKKRYEKAEIDNIEYEAFDGHVPELLLTMTVQNCKMVDAYCEHRT